MKLFHVVDHQPHQADPERFFETRRVTIAGIHPKPYGAWMEQLARNLTDPVEGVCGPRPI